MASHDSLTPDFIRFLFSTKPKFDCYFKVGNEAEGKHERIGAVKLMLMAHSEVFRAELEYSDIKEKTDVPIKDIHPDTFRGMLRYVYGNDTTADMCFDDADNLLYVAEKYMMKTFKDKLATRLMKLLNTDNICSLMNNPACYTHLELNSAITDILRYETDTILASPQFLWMNADSFLRILEQDGLAVPEIELWRAAIKWGKNKANSEDGQLVRQQLPGLIQHLRPFALSGIEIFEIISYDILTKDETKMISVYQLNKKQYESQDLSDFSKETKPRKILQKKQEQKRKQGELLLANLIQIDNYGRHFNFTLLTKKNSIELLPLVCRSKDRDRNNPEHWTYPVNCTTTITKVANPYKPSSSSDNERPTVVAFSGELRWGVEFEIPLAVDGRNIILLADTKYRVKMELSDNIRQHCSDMRGSGRYENDHLVLDISVSYPSHHIYEFPSSKLRYRVVTTAE